MVKNKGPRFFAERVAFERTDLSASVYTEEDLESLIPEEDSFGCTYAAELDSGDVDRYIDIGNRADREEGIKPDSWTPQPAVDAEMIIGDAEMESPDLYNTLEALVGTYEGKKLNLKEAKQMLRDCIAFSEDEMELNMTTDELIARVITESKTYKDQKEFDAEDLFDSFKPYIGF